MASLLQDTLLLELHFQHAFYLFWLESFSLLNPSTNKLLSFFFFFNSSQVLLARKRGHFLPFSFEKGNGF
jgi:hypothetical protein